MHREAVIARRRLAAAVVASALVSALVLGACSGPSSVTKQEFAKRAATICRDADASVAKVRADASTPASLAASIGGVVSVEQAAARRVRALPQPPGDEQLLSRWLGYVDQALVQLAAAGRAAAAGDGPAAAAANLRAQALDQQADAIADRYGLEACAGPR